MTIIFIFISTGARRSRRFPQGSACGLLFAWVDTLADPGAPDPTRIRLVAAYPRRVVEAADTRTLAEAGLTGRQEMLFVETLGEGSRGGAA